MAQQTVCILGGTGFVGHEIASRLETLGVRTRIITRAPEHHRDLEILPQCTLIEGDIHDEATLVREFHGVDAVINLVGILNENRHDGSGFRHAHVELTRKVVQACKQAGVNRLLHMSALNASASTGPSHYLRTKGEAENLLPVSGGGTIATTIFQPSVIFGADDSFINRFAALLRLVPGVFPLACPEARFAPVYVGDVADAFVNSIEDRETFGQRYQLCGPREYTLRELVEYTADLIGVQRMIVGLPDWAAALQARVFEFVPGKPFSVDNYNSLKQDSVCTQSGLDRLGIVPTALEAVAPLYLAGGKVKGRFDTYRKVHHH